MLSPSPDPTAFFSAQLLDDPYAVYAGLRASGRIQWSPALDRWLVLGLPEVAAVLRDARFSADRSRRYGAAPAPGPRALPFTDPPDHTRLRRHVLHTFTPRLVEQLRPRIQQIVDRALDEAQARGRLELIGDLAYPLPLTVIAELLGVPPGEHTLFQAASAALVKALDLEGGLQAAQAAAEELGVYLSGIVDRRDAGPADDLISRLVQARDGTLSRPELLQLCVALLVGGHETTVNLIGNGVYALLQYPAQLGRLRRQPELMATAIEELVRFDAPVQLTHRVATESVDLEGHPVQSGQLVMLAIGAANRDPAVFQDPDRLDVAREPNHHLSFGHAAHFCIGAPLARLEGQIAIGSLVQRFPNLRLDGQPRRRSSTNLRGFATVSLAVT